jgi:heme-degrading monooxygenase HmoA
MYVTRREVRVVGGRERDFRRMNEAMQTGMKDAGGFRWAMLLRSIGYPSKLASLAMWDDYAAAQAWSNSDASAAVFAGHPVQGMVSPLGPAHGYEVATARGAMSPASYAAIVDWEVEASQAAAFTQRWNAQYHAVEEKLGSRLLRHAGQPTLFAGLHVAIDEAALKTELLWQAIGVSEDETIAPAAMDRFEVLLQTLP